MELNPHVPFGEFVLSGPDLLLALVLGLTLASGVVIVAWVFAEAAHAIGSRSPLIARFVRFFTRPLWRLRP